MAGELEKPPAVIAKKKQGGTPERVDSTVAINTSVRRVCAAANIRGTEATRDASLVYTPEALLRAIAEGDVGIVNMCDPKAKVFTFQKKTGA